MNRVCLKSHNRSAHSLLPFWLIKWTAATRYCTRVHCSHTPATDGTECRRTYMVVGIGKYEHITPVLRDTLHWLPVTARIQFKIAALTFNCVRGTGPIYLKQVICPVSDLSRRSLRSAGRGDLFVLRANTSIGQRSFSIAAPVVWNALPPDLRSPHISRPQFRSKLKTHLFRQAYTNTFIRHKDRQYKIETETDGIITLHESSENNSVEQ